MKVHLNLTTNDPEGRRWEVYTVHEETEMLGDAGTTCCTARGTGSGCCGGA